MICTEHNLALSLFKAFLHLISVHSAAHPLAPQLMRAFGGYHYMVEVDIGSPQVQY